MATGRKTGGRRKGTPNKLKAEVKTKEIKRLSIESGKTPLEFMLAAMDDQNNSFEVRADMAKAAAPYVHARKVHAEIDHSFDRAIDRLERGRQRARGGNDETGEER